MMKVFAGAATTVCLTLLCLFPALSVAAMDSDDAPESVTLDYLEELYEAVTFDHQMHVDMLACASCHHHTTGDDILDDSCRKCHANSPAADDVSCSGCHEEKGSATTPLTSQSDSDLYHIDKLGLKGALHLQCLGCHKSESGPTGCRDCHDFTPAGKKRFAVGKQLP